MVMLNGKLFLTMLIVALVVVYLVKSSPAQEPVPRKRRRNHTAANPNPKPPANPLSILLQCVKWETISNMLCLKSEMSNLDGLLEDLQQQEKPPPHHPSK